MNTDMKNKLDVLNAVWLYDEDEACRRLVDESAEYGVYREEVLRKQEDALPCYGEDYARVVAPGMADEPMGLVEQTIAGMPEGKRGVYQGEFDRLKLSGKDTRLDYYALYGRMVRDEVRGKWNERQARIKAVEESLGRMDAYVRGDEIGEAFTEQDLANVRGVMDAEAMEDAEAVRGWMRTYMLPLAGKDDAEEVLRTVDGLEDEFFEVVGTNERRAELAYDAMMHWAEGMKQSGKVGVADEFVVGVGKKLSNWANPRARALFATQGAVGAAGAMNTGTLQRAGSEIQRAEREAKERQSARSILRAAINKGLELGGNVGWWRGAARTAAGMAGDSSAYLLPGVGLMAGSADTVVTGLTETADQFALGGMTDGEATGQAVIQSGVQTVVELMPFGKVGGKGLSAVTRKFFGKGLEAGRAGRFARWVVRNTQSSTARALVAEGAASFVDEGILEPIAGGLMTYGAEQTFDVLGVPHAQSREFAACFDELQTLFADPYQAAGLLLFTAGLTGAGAYGVRENVKYFAKRRKMWEAAGLTPGQVDRVMAADDRAEIGGRLVREGWESDPAGMRERVLAACGEMAERGEVLVYTGEGALDAELENSELAPAYRAVWQEYQERGLLPQVEAVGENQYRITKEGVDITLDARGADAYLQHAIDEVDRAQTRELQQRLGQDHQVDLRAELADAVSTIAGGAAMRAAEGASERTGVAVTDITKGLPEWLADGIVKRGQITLKDAQDITEWAIGRIDGLVEEGMSPEDARLTRAAADGMARTLGDWTTFARDFAHREQMAGLKEGEGAISISRTRGAETVVFDGRQVLGETIMLLPGNVRHYGAVEDVTESFADMMVQQRAAVILEANPEEAPADAEAEAWRELGEVVKRARAAVLKADAEAKVEEVKPGDRMSIVEALSTMATSKFVASGAVPGWMRGLTAALKGNLAAADSLTKVRAAYARVLQNDPSAVSELDAMLDKLGVYVQDTFREARVEAVDIQAWKHAHALVTARADGPTGSGGSPVSEVVQAAQNNETAITQSESAAPAAQDVSPAQQATEAAEILNGMVPGSNAPAQMQGVFVDDKCYYNAAGGFWCGMIDKHKLRDGTEQVKVGAKGKHGVIAGRELTGRFQQNVGAIYVWKRTNGELQVISGRHRFAKLMEDDGAQYCNAYVFAEDAEHDERWARMLDYENNMRDDQADEVTAATYVRETGLSDAELEVRGLMRNGTRCKRGAFIGRFAREELWTRFVNGAVKAMDAEIICNLTRSIRDQARVEEIQRRCCMLLDEKKSWEYIGAMVQLMANKERVVLRQGLLDFGADFEADLARAAEWIERNVRAINESITLLKQGRKLSGKKREEAERLGISTATQEGTEQMLYDLEMLRGQFEMIGSYPDLVAAAQMWDGQTKVDPVGQYLERARAEREQARAEGEMDAEEYAEEQARKAAAEAGPSLFSMNMLRATPEMAEIKEAAERNGTFMKAPNGKPSKLTERQWLQVRTQAFKNWFGDWEKVARFRAVRDAIMSMPMVAELTGKEFRSDGVPLTDKVPAYWQGAYQSGVESPELGHVVLDKEGVKSSMGHGIGALKAAAFHAVPEVIRKGKVFDRRQNWKGRGYDTAVLAAPISIGGKEYICEVVVEQRPNRQGFYLHEVEVKEKLGNVFKTATKGSTRQASRSILALRAAEVNTIWENCSKVVDENGEPLVVYHGTVHGGFRVFDVDGRGKTEGTGAFFTSDKRVAEGYSANLHTGGIQPEVYACFLNIRTPYEVDFEGNTWNRVPGRAAGYFVHYDNSESEWFSNKADADFAVSDYEGNAEIEEDWEESPTLDDLAREVWEETPEVDGIIAKNVVDTAVSASKSYPATDFIVASPNQIKSATQNRGTFDGSNADITFSVQRKRDLTLDGVRVTQKEAWAHLAELEGKPLRNARSQFVAVVNKPQRKELTNMGKAWKSANNGFSIGAHYEAVSRIEKLFEHAVPCGEYPDSKNEKADVKILRFACPMMLSGEKAVAWMTAKKSADKKGGERLYNLELVDIERLAGKLESEQQRAARFTTDKVTPPPASRGIVAEVEEAFKTYFEKVPDDSPVSFSVIGPHAKIWDKYKERAFTGRDDGMQRAEIDASGELIKWKDLRGKNVAAYRKLVENWDKQPEETRKQVEAYADQAYDYQDESKKLNSTPEDEFLEQYNRVIKLRDSLKPKREKIRDLLNKALVEHGGGAGVLLNAKDAELDKLAMSLWGPFVDSEVEEMLDMRPLWNGGMKLADVLEYPELYEAYPELADVTVRYATMDTAYGRAYYEEGEHAIAINRNLEGDWEQMQSVLLHEIQHFIQKIEGFAKGGNPTHARRMVDNRAAMGDTDALALREHSDKELYLRLAGEIEARNVQQRMGWNAETRAAIPFNETLAYPGEALVSFSMASVPLYHEILNTFEQRLSKDNKAVWVSRTSGNNMFTICPYPDVLNAITPWMRDVIAGKDVIKKLMNKHHLLPQDVAKLPHALWDPIAVFEDPKAKQGGFIVVSDIMASNNEGVMKHVMVVLELKADNHNAVITDVKSAYSADKTDKYAAMLNKGYLRYADKERALLWAGAEGDSILQLLTTALRHSGSKLMLKENMPGVNTIFTASMEKASLRALDMLTIRADERAGEQLIKDWQAASENWGRFGREDAGRLGNGAKMLGEMQALIGATKGVLPERYCRMGHLNGLMRWASIYAKMQQDGTLPQVGEIKGPIYQKFLEKLQQTDELNRLQGMSEQEAQEAMALLAGERLDTAMLKVARECRRRLEQFLKDRELERIEHIVEKAYPKRQSGQKWPRGKMAAEAYRRMERAREYMNLPADEVAERINDAKRKLDALDATDADFERKEEELEEEISLLQTFGCWEDMGFEQARRACGVMMEMVLLGRARWKEKLQAERRRANYDRAQMSRHFRTKLGDVQRTRAKTDAKEKARKRTIGKKLAMGSMSYSQLMLALEPQLGKEFTGRHMRMIAKAHERLQTGTQQLHRRMFSTLSEITGLKTEGEMEEWLKSNNEIIDTGIVLKPRITETCRMTPEEVEEWLGLSAAVRAERRKQAEEEAGAKGELPDNVPSEDALEKMREKLEASRKAGTSPKEYVVTIEKRYESPLHCTKEAMLFAILTFEQEDYTRLMDVNGVNEKALQRMRELVGDKLLRWGYAMREILNEQGMTMAAIYEAHTGVPFAKRANYFRGVFDIAKAKDKGESIDSATSITGGKYGCLIPRQYHHQMLNWGTSATQVFIGTYKEQQNYICTSHITREWRTLLSNQGFEKRLRAEIGDAALDMIHGWCKMIDGSVIADAKVNAMMNRMLGRVMGAYAVSRLAGNVYTIIKQVSAVLNGFVGGYVPEQVLAGDAVAQQLTYRHIGFGEYAAALARAMSGQTEIRAEEIATAGFIAGRNRVEGAHLEEAANLVSGQSVPGKVGRVGRAVYEANMDVIGWADRKSNTLAAVAVADAVYRAARQENKEGAVPDAQLRRVAIETAGMMIDRAAQPQLRTQKGYWAAGGGAFGAMGNFFYMFKSEVMGKLGLYVGQMFAGQHGAWVGGALSFGVLNSVVLALIDYVRGYWYDDEEDKWAKRAKTFAWNVFANDISAVPVLGDLEGWARSTVLGGRPWNNSMVDMVVPFKDMYAYGKREVRNIAKGEGWDRHVQALCGFARALGAAGGWWQGNSRVAVGSCAELALAAAAISNIVRFGKDAVKKVED